MPRKPDYSYLSELEREFELEMEDGPPEGLEFELAEETEAGDERQYEFEDLERELEQADDAETMLEGDYSDVSGSGEYVERLLELSAREFESAWEVDQALSEIVDTMEGEFFISGLARAARKLGKSKILRALAKKGMQLGASQFLPGLKGALQLARGNVKGALLNFGKQALGTVVPGGTMTLDAVKALGLGASEFPDTDRETWENYVDLSRDAYEYLADNITASADQPAEASRLANNAIQHAVRRAQARATGARRTNRIGSPSRVLRLRVAPGQRIKLIITGG
jgi:hypothetical protein